MIGVEGDCSQMTIVTSVHKSQMAKICIGGNCEQLRFVNNTKLQARLREEGIVSSSEFRVKTLNSKLATLNYHLSSIPYHLSPIPYHLSPIPYRAGGRRQSADFLFMV